MITEDRNYRNFEMRLAEEGDMRIEGYACVFNSPTVMYRADDIEYKEMIDANAFANCMMSDVVLNYNHQGKPIARTKNGTLELSVDDKGLFISADLSGTAEGRKMYEEVKGGYIDKMSFAFTVADEEYDKATHTRIIRGIDRLFDTACVDIPAYDTTSVYARSFYKAEAEREQAEACKRAEDKMRLELKLKLEGF